MTKEELNNFQGIIDNMKHMLGIDLTRLRKGQREYDCPRNGFYGDDDYLNIAADLQLVEKIDAESLNGRHSVCYYVTQEGFDFLSKLFGITFSY